MAAKKRINTIFKITTKNRWAAEGLKCATCCHICEFSPSVFSARLSSINASQTRYDIEIKKLMSGETRQAQVRTKELLIKPVKYNNNCSELRAWERIPHKVAVCAGSLWRQATRCRLMMIVIRSRCVQDVWSIGFLGIVVFRPVISTPKIQSAPERREQAWQSTSRALPPKTKKTQHNLIPNPSGNALTLNIKENQTPTDKMGNKHF